MIFWCQEFEFLISLIQLYQKMFFFGYQEISFDIYKKKVNIWYSDIDFIKYQKSVGFF